MNRILPTILLLACGCNRPPTSDTLEPSDEPAEPADGVAPSEDPADGEFEPASSPPTDETAESDEDQGALEALFGERGCRQLLGKLQGPWAVGPADAPELWDVGGDRVQIERGEVREMRALAAHSSISLEIRDVANDTSRRFVLAQDDHAVHFGEGVGGMKTELGYVLALPDHHLVVSSAGCRAYDVERCEWGPSPARYFCTLDESGESMTIRQLDVEGEPVTLQLGSGGVAVDQMLRRSTLRSRR